ncbi:MAG TPA: beta-L-arabinofuranosidase domain-containing protein [Anaeromyxobacter sp.]|nr:beta-L-arabinofuranosidase domain-containing protein [Anaeromyxobacter sp.]
MSHPSPRQAPVIDVARSPHARLAPVPVSAVRLEGGLWGARRETDLPESLFQQWEQLEITGRLDNFRRVAGKSDNPYQGRVFNDSDLYKWLEAASWWLVRRSNPRLEGLVEEGILLAEGAQQPDGYLDTYYSLERGGERWTNLRDNHELYCAGHLFQAAVAHHRATGSERLLRVATRLADMICTEFGPPGTGRRQGIDGHQEVEMALIELFRETGQRRYLDTARYFLEARGYGLLEGGWFNRTYFQDHAPFRALEKLAGHAVRALYYACGVTDLFLETGDRTLLGTLERLFTRMEQRQLYVTGGVGARHDGESFGADYELPNGQAYTETCAAIALAMWCHRMLAATGEARYADLLEWTLHNGVLPAWSLDARAYLYVNPLEDDGGHRRRPWYHCACCPPNLARTVASFPGLLYSTRGDELFVHLYAPGEATLELGGRTLLVRQRTRYPWDGRIELELDGEGEFSLNLRVPAWVGQGAALLLNGEAAVAPLRPGTYVALRRYFSRGDQIELSLPMPVRLLEAHPYVAEDVGCVALTRGPILYCAEGVDHPGLDLRDLRVDPARPPQAAPEPGLPGGMVALHGPATLAGLSEAWHEQIYLPVGTAPPAAPRPAGLRAVPYLAWGNRAPGPMRVWLRRNG